MATRTHVPAEETARKFRKFHEANPHVYELFKTFAREAREKKGRKRLGANAIINRMRWYAAFETTDKEYKVNDIVSGFYPRMLAAEDPSFADFFEFRASAADTVIPRPAARPQPEAADAA